jgi:acetyltransferase-like isoleucine patch superfamily enzyme
MQITNLLKYVYRQLGVRFYYFWGGFRTLSKGIALGTGARISPFCELNAPGNFGRVIIATGVHIGPGTYIGSGSVDSGFIGAFCSIGYGIQIGPTEHNTRHWTTSPYLLRALKDDPCNADRITKPPRIGSDVWLGSAVIVLRGSVIGDGAVIGAGSIVKGTVPPYDVWAGAPARKIKNRFTTNDEKHKAEEAFKAGLNQLNLDTEKWSVKEKPAL